MDLGLSLVGRLVAKFYQQYHFRAFFWVGWLLGQRETASTFGQRHNTDYRLSCVIGPFGWYGPAATLWQRCPQMARRRGIYAKMFLPFSTALGISLSEVDATF